MNARFELPDWICAAEVTSNTLPVLWRIDASNGRVTRHEPLREADPGSDIGFSGFPGARAADVFLSAITSHGLLWRGRRALTLCGGAS